MDNAKIEGALSALVGLPDAGRVEVTDLGFAMRDTGLTVAELREILEVARGQAWRPASEKPDHQRWVQAERPDGRVTRARWLHGDAWLSPTFGLIGVRRWRELRR